MKSNKENDRIKRLEFENQALSDALYDLAAECKARVDQAADTLESLGSDLGKCKRRENTHEEMGKE